MTTSARLDDRGRCVLSDLPPGMCAHCRGHSLDPAIVALSEDWSNIVDIPSIDVDPPARRSPGVQLVRPATCIRCRTKLSGGTMVYPNEDGFYTCADCIGD